MKALLLTPDSQSITEVEVDGLDDIKGLIGFDTIASDAVGVDGDHIFFDEECFLRQSSGRFQVDTLVPISGKAVFVRANDAGEPVADVGLSAEDLAGRIKYDL